MRSRYFISLALVGIFTLLMPAHADDGSIDQQLDNFIHQAMEQIPAMPGLGVGVVKAGRIIYSRGFGYRNVEEKLPATTETAFYLASGTKGLTGMTAAVLATSGRLNLEAPISSYLTKMKLPSPLNPDEITVRQLLTHTAGIGNREAQEYLAFRGELSRKKFLKVLAKKSEPIPTDFIYMNLGYNIFGYLLEAAFENSWKEIVRETVIEPVGMARTTSSMSEAERSEIAYGYRMEDESYVRLPLKTDGMMHAAGGHVTSVTDVCRWLIANLEGGVIDGRQVLPAKAVQLAHRRHAELDRDFYLFHREAYGLGIYHSAFDGEQLMHHFGGYNGFHAHTSFMPEHAIGVVALTNSNDYGTSAVPHVIAAFAYALLLDRPESQEKWRTELEKIAERVAGEKNYQDGLRSITKLVESGDMDEAIARIGAVLADGSGAGLTSERDLNLLGYGFLGDQHIELATKVFQIIIDEYPDTPNNYDSLGETYEKAGRKSLARKNYAIAVEKAKTQGDDNLKLFEKNLKRVGG